MIQIPSTTTTTTTPTTLCTESDVNCTSNDTMDHISSHYYCCYQRIPILYRTGNMTQRNLFWGIFYMEVVPVNVIVSLSVSILERMEYLCKYLRNRKQTVIQQRRSSRLKTQQVCQIVRSQRRRSQRQHQHRRRRQSLLHILSLVVMLSIIILIVSPPLIYTTFTRRTVVYAYIIIAPKTMERRYFQQSHSFPLLQSSNCKAITLLTLQSQHNYDNDNNDINIKTDFEKDAVYSSTSTTTTITTTTRPNPVFTNSNNDNNIKQLNQYTIKELRDMILSYATATTTIHNNDDTNNVKNENNINNDTVNDIQQQNTIATTTSWSKLKRKQDYIDYILQLQQQQKEYGKRTSSSSTSTSTSSIPLQQSVLIPSNIITNNGNTTTTSSSTSTSAVTTKSYRKNTKMPPISSSSTSSYMNNNNKNYLTPKDLIVEQVYQRYPTLRPTTTTTNNIIINSATNIYNNNNNNNIPNDIRQEYHPVMRHLVNIHGSSNENINNVVTDNDETNDTMDTNGFDSDSNNYYPTTSPMIQSDMDIICIGTASCTPGITRGVSCTAIRCNWNRRGSSSTNSATSNAVVGTTLGKNLYNNDHQNNMNSNGVTEGTSTTTTSSTIQQQQPQSGTWIFDVGECTQLQIQKTTSVKPGKITKIFLTHAHGDHTFGLPGLLCLMGQDRSNDAPVVEIYGPEGLRMWLRTAIRYSVSRIVPPYRVHEIMNIPMAPPWEYNPRSRRYYYKGAPDNAQWNVHKGLAGEDMTNWISQSSQLSIEPSSMYGEVDGGRNIYPMYNHPQSVNGAPIWLMVDDPDVQVFAAPMSHGIPCVGYVIQEQPRAGRLRNEYVEPIVQRNKAALIKAGFTIPMKALAIIKNLPLGATFTFPDGTVVRQEDAVEPERTGRKIVICGDTSCAMAMSKLALNADVVIHEATNAYLTGVDTKDTTLSQVTRDAIIHGHSTPQMAAMFCKKVQGQILLMNHFSARYKGDPSVDSLSIMLRIEKQACQAAKYNETQVIAAWDMMILPVPQH